jgi:hypothetical protein
VTALSDTIAVRPLVTRRRGRQRLKRVKRREHLLRGMMRCMSLGKVKRTW